LTGAFGHTIILVGQAVASASGTHPAFALALGAGRIRFAMAFPTRRNQPVPREGGSVYSGTIELRRLNGVRVLALHGEHDLSTLPSLRRELADALDCAAAIVVDLSHAEFIDSTVLGALARAHDSTSNGDLRFAVVAPAGSFVRQLLDLVSLSEPMGTQETLADAVASVSHDDLLGEAAS
jgi:anti-anti-sigma factor